MNAFESDVLAIADAMFDGCADRSWDEDSAAIELARAVNAVLAGNQVVLPTDARSVVILMPFLGVSADRGLHKEVAGFDVSIWVSDGTFRPNAKQIVRNGKTELIYCASMVQLKEELQTLNVRPRDHKRYKLAYELATAAKVGCYAYMAASNEEAAALAGLPATLRWQTISIGRLASALRLASYADLGFIVAACSAFTPMTARPCLREMGYLLGKKLERDSIVARAAPDLEGEDLVGRVP